MLYTKNKTNLQKASLSANLPYESQSTGRRKLEDQPCILPFNEETFCSRLIAKCFMDMGKYDCDEPSAQRDTVMNEPREWEAKQK